MFFLLPVKVADDVRNEILRWCFPRDFRPPSEDSLEKFPKIVPKWPDERCRSQFSEQFPQLQFFSMASAVRLSQWRPDEMFRSWYTSEFKEARKGFFVDVVFAKRWKITKKDI